MAQPNNPINDPNANAVPPQNSPAPIAAPNPAPAVDSNTAAPALSQMPGNTPAAPTVTPGQTMPDNPHKSIIGSVFQDLAGGKTTDFLKTPNGPVAVKRNLAPGEIARNILASAFSLLGAGAGGALAAKEKRPYVQPEDQTIGGMEQNRVAARQQEAQKEFADQQAASELQRQQAADAREQQIAIAQLQRYSDEHHAAQLAQQAGLQDQEERSFNNLVKNATAYNQAMAMPGAQIMKDANGRELNFYDIGTPGQPGFVSAGSQLQKYALAHPEVLHGSSDGTSRYGVVPVINPYTGAVQIVDYPADRHSAGLEYVGAKRDANGDVMFDKSGEPVPDGTIVDPVSHKPTVLSETVTPDQARAIKAQNLGEANTRSEISDRDAQRRQREAAIKKNQDLQDALSVWDDGAGIGRMTPSQKKIVATMVYQQQTLAARRLKEAQDQYDRVTQNGINTDSDDAKQAAAELTQAKQDYAGLQESYRDLSGITPGVMLGNRLIAQSGGNPDWAVVNAQIEASGLSPDEKKRAKDTAWNRLTPAQQQAARVATQVGLKGGAATSTNQPRIPLVKPPKVGAKIDVADATKYVQAAGGDKAKARQMAAADGWSF